MEPGGASEHGALGICRAQVSKTAGMSCEGTRNSVEITKLIFLLSYQLSFVGRKPYAAPATGISNVHLTEAEKLLTDTFSSA